MAPGGYVEADITIDTTKTAASSITIHGGGAGLIYPSSGDSPMFASYIPLTIHNLEFSIPSGAAGYAMQLSGGASLLDHVRVHDARYGASVAGTTTLRDVEFENVERAIVVQPTGALKLESGVIRGGVTGIVATQGGSVQITNLLAWGTSDVALDLSGTSGNVAFSTIADAGADTGTGPRAVRCANGIVVRSSIVWAPGNTARVPMDGCSLVNVLAGPSAVAGASNTNPQFVNAANHDYHISASSPAHDAADTGPALDFEGDPRPRGAKFDIGADEAP